MIMLNVLILSSRLFAPLGIFIPNFHSNLMNYYSLTAPYIPICEAHGKENRINKARTRTGTQYPYCYLQNNPQIKLKRSESTLFTWSIGTGSIPQALYDIMPVNLLHPIVVQAQIEFSEHLSLSFQVILLNRIFISCC